MRALSTAVCLMAAAAAAATAGCKSSTGAADAAPAPVVCTAPLTSDCASPIIGGASLCTLAGGIEFACSLCASEDAGCGAVGALVHGARYTYVQAFYVDVWNYLVYDQTGTLVARLGLGAGTGWDCVQGPADFDTSEAISLLPVNGMGELVGMCGTAADAGS